MCQADSEKTEQEQTKIAERKALGYLREHPGAVRRDFLVEYLRFEGVPDLVARAALRNLVDERKVLSTESGLEIKLSQ